MGVLLTIPDVEEIALILRRFEMNINVVDAANRDIIKAEITAEVLIF
jgi:hypothetical protein